MPPSPHLAPIGGRPAPPIEALPVAGQGRGPAAGRYVAVARTPAAAAAPPRRPGLGPARPALVRHGPRPAPVRPQPPPQGPNQPEFPRVPRWLAPPPVPAPPLPVGGVPRPVHRGPAGQ